jgi:Domain of Unknown Function (DUF928)
MIKHKQKQRWVAPAIGFLACTLGGLLTWQAVAVASTVMFVPPAGGAPRETKGGAARGDVLCTASIEPSAQKLVLIAPATSSRGLTTLERPTFLIYVPPTSAGKALFSLKTDKSQKHYRAFVPVPQQGGIVRVTLPSDAPPLALNQSYEWGFALLCGGKLRPDSPAVSSNIQRTQLEAKAMAALAGQSPLEQAGVYGANGIWYDMIATIATLRYSQPQDPTLNATWNQLLKSAGLETVATAPVNN